MVYVNAIAAFSTTAVNASVTTDGANTFVDVDVNKDGIFGVGDTRVYVAGQDLTGTAAAAGGLISF